MQQVPSCSKCPHAALRQPGNISQLHSAIKAQPLKQGCCSYAIPQRISTIPTHRRSHKRTMQPQQSVMTATFARQQQTFSSLVKSSLAFAMSLLVKQPLQLQYIAAIHVQVLLVQQVVLCSPYSPYTAAHPQQHDWLYLKLRRHLNSFCHSKPLS